MREAQRPEQGSEDITEDTDSQASAMALLDPHLPTLSQYWLAALKDHAYLSLPSQFSSQLPPSGGTFYTVDVMESVKPYYEANWASLLYAAAIWLESNGLKMTIKPTTPSMQQPLVGDTASSGKPIVPSSDLRYEYFHLVLGLAVQSLCIPATLDQPVTVINCLKALQGLLRSKFVQKEIMSDSQLAIEVMSVLHRLLLTCQSQKMHVVVLEIATQVGNALRESAISSEQDFDLESSVDPGKSCAYALLEVSACCLLRLIPDLRPKDSDSTVIPVSQSGTPSKEELCIISQTVSILVTASTLCAPQACIQVLPTVLLMLLTALKYTSMLQLQPNPSTPAILQSLKLLCSTLPVSGGGSKVVNIVQSALASVLGTAKGEEDQWKLSQMGDETRLLVVAILLHVPATVCPPSSCLFDSCIQLFKQCFESRNSKVRSSYKPVVLQE